MSAVGRLAPVDGWETEAGLALSTSNVAASSSEDVSTMAEEGEYLLRPELKPFYSGFLLSSCSSKISRILYKIQGKVIIYQVAIVREKSGKNFAGLAKIQRFYIKSVRETSILQSQ